MNSKAKLLYRNMLLPFNGLPVIGELDSEPERGQQQRKEPAEESQDKSSSNDSDTNTESDDDDQNETTRPEVPRYAIPARRNQKERYEMSIDISNSQTTSMGRRQVGQDRPENNQRQTYQNPTPGNRQM